MHHVTDYIHPEESITLDGLFQSRARRSANVVAYRYFDADIQAWQSYTWQQMANMVAHWQAAMQREHLQVGDRVAVMLKNCPEWVVFDQAALGLGLVVVPLYTADRPENAAFVLENSGAKLLLVGNTKHWHAIHELDTPLQTLQRIVTLKTPPEGDNDERLRGLEEWLPEVDSRQLTLHRSQDGQALASIVYTSGTSGRSKGVMLTHANMLANIDAGLSMIEVYPEDSFLSFLPLSHTLERTAGYYLPMMAGSTVAFARSVQQLQEDMLSIQPTVMIVVPRVFERIYTVLRNRLDKGSALERYLFQVTVKVGYSVFERQQGRARFGWAHCAWPILKRLVADKLKARFGGRMRGMIAGSAALSPDIAQVFLGLGVPVLQGYGLTEASPVVSVNTLSQNHPATVGCLLPNLSMKIDSDQVLHVKGPSVMQGYWQDEAATQAVLNQGWLNTGDMVSVDEQGQLKIIGRKKEIIVLSNGEKISPVEMESAILLDALFEQVMVVGEGNPYLSAFVVVSHDAWQHAAAQRDLPGHWPSQLHTPQAAAFVLARIAQMITAMPGYARIRRVTVLHEPWTIESGALTPTLKVKRHVVLTQQAAAYNAMYQGFKLDGQ